MSNKKARNTVLRMTVLTAALTMAYANSWAEGSVAYTPYPVSTVVGPGGWVLDRTGGGASPPTLESATWEGRDDALRLSITKPASSDSSFYNWQGFKQETQVPAGNSFLRGDIWINDDWQTTDKPNVDFVNTGMWGSAMPEDVVDGGTYVDAEAVFPILHFTNEDGVGKLRIWDTTAASGWVYLDDTVDLVNYGAWNSIDLRLVPGEGGAETLVEYYFNGQKVYTWTAPKSSSGSTPEQFFSMYLNARNGTQVTNFDTYWSRLLAGAVYTDGIIEGPIKGDVLVDAGANVSVADGTTIGGTLQGNGNSASGAIVNFDKDVAIGGQLIGTNTAFHFSTNPDAVAQITGNVILEDGSFANGGSADSRISTNGNIQVENSTLAGYWQLPSGKIIALNGAVIENADVVAGTGNGLEATSADSTVTVSNSSLTTGNGKYGLLANNGSTVHVAGGSITNESTSSGRMGIAAIGEGTAITANGAAISTYGQYIGSGELSNAVAASDGARIELVGGQAEYLGEQYGRGILASTNATVTTEDTKIRTTGAMSNAVHAYSGRTTMEKPEDTPTIEVTGGELRTTNHDSYGILSQNIGSRITADGAQIITEGADSFGAVVFNGAHLGLTNTTITTEGAGARGVSLNATSTVQKPGSPATPISSTLTMTDGGISTQGDDAHGLYLTEASTAELTDVAVAVTGVGSTGVRVEKGSTATLSGGSVSSIGDDRGEAVYATGDGSLITATDVAIVSQRRRVDSTSKPIGVGVEGVRGGKVELIRGSVSTQQDWNDGILAYRGIVETNGTHISTNGLASTGVKAWREVSGYEGVTAIATLAGGSVTTQGNESYGLLAQNAGSTIDAREMSVTTSGAQSYGVNAYNGGAAVLNSVTVKTSGANAHGLVMGGMSDTMRPGSDGRIPTEASSITMTGGSVEATGTGASGLYLEDSGSIDLNNVLVIAGGSTISSKLAQSEQAQTITVGSGSTLDKNNGTLLRVDRTAEGVDGTVHLTLQNGSHASGNIRNYDADGNLVAHTDTFSTIDVQEGAIWAGIFVDPGDSVVDGDDDMDDFTTGEGESVVIEGTGSGTQNFNGTTNIGGSVSVGRDVSFNGPTTIGNDLNGQDGTSTSVEGSATIGGSINGGAGSSFTFNDTAGISGGVGGAAGSNFNFNGDTNIGGGVQGNGSNMTFGGPANIGGGVTGQGGASFSFSQTGSSSIGGDVNLGGGSSLGGGSMNNPINVGGNAIVGSGSRLGGNLNVTGSLSGSGGTFAPGNSIGAQTYGSMGSFTGTYVAEVNSAGLSDLVTITSGNADLTGIDLKVSQENGNGGYKLYHDYTIVKTGKADGISAVAGNKFASEALDDTFAGTLVKLDPAKFGTNDVKISLSVDGDAIDRTGLSSNQSATLDGALSVAGQNASADAVMFMQPDARKDALNQLSGELHGSTQAALLQTSSLVSRTLSARMRGNLGAGMQPGAPTAQAGGAVAGSMPTSTAYPLWAQVVGNWNTLDSDGNAAKVKTNTAGLFIGGDTDVGSGWRVGGALGYTDGRVKVDDRDSRSDVGTFTAALYGGNSWDQGNGKLNFLAGAAYSHHSIDTRRSVNVGGNQTLKADYSAHTTQLFTELGYAMPVGERSVVEPYVGLAWLSQKARGFTEEGGAAALSADSQKDDVTTFTLGLRGKTALNVGSNPAHLFAGLGWRHASGDVDPGRSVSFVQGGGAAFNVAGAPIAKNAAVFDLGVEMSVGRNTAMGLGYSGQYGSDNTDHSGQLYLRARF